ncbi:MAG: RHS repeat-associated core domain-containing protein [Calditrichaceae bacterium]
MVTDDEYQRDTEIMNITVTHSNRYYYLKDHLGNIRVTVNEFGQAEAYNDYYPFGLQMPGRSVNNAMTDDIYKFGGKELDEESGLNWYYFGARYYDPATGRWLTSDPALTQWSPQRIMAHQLYGLSPYVYVRNNPLNRFDPDGFKDWPTFWGGVAKVGGGALGIAITSYGIAQTGGIGAAFGAGAGYTTSLYAIDTGIMDIVSGLQDKSTSLADGVMVPTLVAGGMKKENAIVLAGIYDLLEMGVNVSNAGKKTGTILHQLKSFLDAGNLTGDVKKWVEEQAKQLEAEEKKRQEEERKRREEEERRKKEEEQNQQTD